MLNAKFKKTAEAVYISHIDVQNAINRTIRRAGFEPKLSAGFNPHTLLKLSSPLPLGVASEAEYFTLYLDGIDPDDFVARFNENSPHGLKAAFALVSEKNPNLAGTAVASDYIIRGEGLAARAEDLRKNAKEGFIVAHKTKEGVTEKEVKELIVSIDAHPEGLLVRLASGNTTLRPDRFAEALGGYLGIIVPLSAVLRTAQYVKKDDVFIDADAYLRDCSQTTENIEISGKM